MRMVTHGVNNASCAADNTLSTNVKGIEGGLPVSLFTDWQIRDLTCIKIRVQVSKAQLCTTGSQLHSKERRIRLTLSDEALEDWRRIVLADALETHSHETVCREA